MFNNFMIDSLDNFTDFSATNNINYLNYIHPETNFNNNEQNNFNRTNQVSFHNYFSKEFVCNNVSLSDLNPRDLLKYESSDKIILPKSAIHCFARYSQDKIYTLRILNPKKSKYAFVGIGDFSAPEHVMFIPTWLMTHINAQNGDKIYVDAISVPTISYAKIKIPDHLNPSILNSNNINIKSLIEFLLQNHSLLFLGKKIRAQIFEKTWEFEVVGLKPINIGSIINTDVHLDLV
jgi:hypothetical protein